MKKATLLYLPLLFLFALSVVMLADNYRLVYRNCLRNLIYFFKRLLVFTAHCKTSLGSTVLLFAAVFISLILSGGCAVENTKTTTGDFNFSSQGAPPISENIFDEFLKSDFAPADGFDFPVGDRDGKGDYVDKSTGKRYENWYVATQFAEEYSLGIHPGEDWNGAGGKNTDLGQDVFAVANGRVVFAENCGRLWGNVIIIEHIFYENNQKRQIRSVYAHLLEIKVTAGETVRRRQIIGSIGQDPDKLFDAHLHLEFRWDASLPPTYWASSNGKDETWVREHYAAPTEFISARRKLFVPQNEPVLILVDQASYKMRLYKSGDLQGEYDVSFGQGKGAKRVQGDNKTPVGMYFVIQKHRGRFDGAYGEYYGGHWIKINYPNKYDAERGLNERIITTRQASTISVNWSERKATLENTTLGGGIGFHGWIREWENEGSRHLSWGCIVMHIYDIRRLYDQIPQDTMVVIF
ncbi:MAG: peptidoglycan DD-metalloendopeptidase family protein [Acidobacteriota bacterium]|nr:peptidoglycan DD-metalloendopeptidase family protein [Acidobacteriota bacterium]